MAQWALEAREHEKQQRAHSQQQLLPLPSTGKVPGGPTCSSTRPGTAGGHGATAAGVVKSATLVSGTRVAIAAAATTAPSAAAAADTELRRVGDLEELAHLWSAADYLQVRGLWQTAVSGADSLHGAR